MINELVKYIDKRSDLKKNTILFIWSKGNLIVGNDYEDILDFISKNFDMNDVKGVFKQDKDLIELNFGDDRSDIRNILNIQKCVKDMIRSKSLKVTNNTKIKVAASDALEKSFKIKNVQQLLNLKHLNFAHIIPFCYHGTDSYRLEFIKKKGILPLKQIDKKLRLKNFEKGYLSASNKLVYLCIDYTRAEYYAQTSSEMINKTNHLKTKPAIIEIRDLPTEFAVTDDDFSTQSILTMLGTADAKNKSSYIKSIRLQSQFGYKSSIPPNMFYKIYILK